MAGAIPNRMLTEALGVLAIFAIVSGIILYFIVLNNGHHYQVDICEAALKDQLKSPSSYRRRHVETTELKSSDGSDLAIEIEYDAANDYNALIRGYKYCSFHRSASESSYSNSRLEQDGDATKSVYSQSREINNETQRILQDSKRY